MSHLNLFTSNGRGTPFTPTQMCVYTALLLYKLINTKIPKRNWINFFPTNILCVTLFALSKQVENYFQLAGCRGLIDRALAQQPRGPQFKSRQHLNFFF